MNHSLKNFQETHLNKERYFFLLFVIVNQRSNRTMNFMKYFKKDTTIKEDIGPSNISGPTNVQHDIHVCKNQITGQLEGLPDAWMRQIGTQISKDEQYTHPYAVLQAVKYYNYSIKKKEEPETFKLFITENEVIKETEDIDNFMNSRDAHQSKDSENFLDDSNAEDSTNRLNILSYKFF